MDVKIWTTHQAVTGSMARSMRLLYDPVAITGEHIGNVLKYDEHTHSFK